MSSWVSGWFSKSTDKSSADSSAAASSSAASSVETAAEIREKRLRKLEATTAAAAAAATAGEPAPGPSAVRPSTAQPASATSSRASTTNAATPAAAASSATAATPASIASPALKPARPVSAMPPSKTLSTGSPPPSPARKVATAAAAAAGVPISPLARAMSGASLQTPQKPGVHALTPQQYTPLRSPLPISLLFSNVVAATHPTAATASASAAGPSAAAERAWEHAALTDIFSISVDPKELAGGGGSRAHRTFLPSLAEEILADATEAAAAAATDATPADVADARPKQVSRAHLDQLVMERLGTFADLPPPLVDSESNGAGSAIGGSTAGQGSFGWMIGCYRRALTIDEKLNIGLAAATAAAAASASAPSSSSSASSGAHIYPSSSADWSACLSSVTLARTCIVRYIGLLLSDEEMFQSSGHRAAARSEFLKLLCSDAAIARTLPPGLFDSLVATYAADPEVFAAIFQPVADVLATPVKFAPTTSRLGEVMPTMDDAQRALLGLAQMFRFAPTAALIVQHPSWLPKAAWSSGRLLQTITTLGPLVSLSTPSTQAEFQQVLNHKPQHELESDIQRLRASFASYQSLLAQVLRHGIKHAAIRESILQWFSALIQANVPRRRMQYHPFEVSSDGCLLNTIQVALRLCQPIIAKKAGPAHARADFAKVDLTYLLQSGGPAQGQRVDYDAITRVQATLADVKSMRAALPDPIVFGAGAGSGGPASPFNFVTEAFFLTHELLHEGLGSMVRQYTELMQQISRDSRELQRMPREALMYDQTALRLDQLFSLSLAARVHLEDPALVGEVIAFYDWTARFIQFWQKEATAELPTTTTTTTGDATSATTTAAGTSPTNATTSSAVPSSTSTAASSTAIGATAVVARPQSLSLASLIPEPIVEDIATFFIYLGRFQSRQLRELAPSAYAGILDLTLSLIAGPFALKNPHLRGQVAEFLTILLPSPDASGHGGVHSDHIFMTHPGLLSGLVPALLELYVRIEEGPRMYYEKYSCRNMISTLLDFLWQLPPHRQQLLLIASGGEQLFVRFINCLLNDLTYLLDEGLKQLGTVREFQQEMEDEERWRSQPSDTLRERERAFHQSEQGATSCMTLANATVHMLFYLSSEIVPPFVAPEFSERMAHMLDLYINQLVGPKISELKVRNRERYAFKPRDLLTEIIGVWLHLSESRSFLEHVAADERSYKPAYFAKAARILRHRAILPERTIARFEELNREVERLAESLLADEDILGEIPDEYQDVMMGTLLTDPVQLPQSKQILDRATIRRQLMNKKVDPFSNTPLTEDMLIEQPELKAEIHAWAEARKKAWREDKQKKDEAAAGGAEDVEEKNDGATSPTAAAAVPSGSSAATSAPPAAAPARRSYLDD